MLSLSTAARPMCCPRLPQVARAIVEGGFSGLLPPPHRVATNPGDVLPDFLDRLGLYDAPEIQRGFVRDAGEHEREASLFSKALPAPLVCG